MVEVMKIMVTSFKRSHAHIAALSAPNPAAGHRKPTPLPETPGHSQASLGQFFVGSLFLGVIDLKKVSFHSNPKERQCQKCSNYCTVALISHTSKVMLKILQARLQQYVNQELPDVQAGFREGRRTRDQIANICWIIDKARELQKNIYFCLIDNAKAFDCVDHNKLWKILHLMGIPDYLTCLLRNLYAG